MAGCGVVGVEVGVRGVVAYFLLLSSCQCVFESPLLAGGFCPLICLMLSIRGVGNVDRKEA